MITAGHCAKNGTGSWAVNWTFVPGFTEGSRPYGSWTARHFFVASQWTHAANDNDDVAFVTLNPQVSGGRTLHIGQVTDALPITFDQRTTEEFAFGYPAEPPYGGGGLYYCSGRVTADAFHASPDSGLRCELTAGSSGGPWLSGFDPVTGRGTITSVSSFKYSTDPSTLYGPPLGAVAQGLFDSAQHSQPHQQQHSSGQRHRWTTPWLPCGVLHDRTRYPRHPRARAQVMAAGGPSDPGGQRARRPARSHPAVAGMAPATRRRRPGHGRPWLRGSRIPATCRGDLIGCP